MIEKIRQQKIVCVIPTMNRNKFLERFFDKWDKHCPLHTEFVIVNGGDKAPLDPLGDIKGIKVIHEKRKGVGLARKIGIDYAMNYTKAKYIFTGDDDCYIGGLAIEKMLAPIVQNKKFACIGHLGGYRAFLRDFDEMEVRFYSTIGVLWVTRRDVVEKVGNLDEKLFVREDNEWQARCWSMGYWTAIVDADVKHKRHQPLEKGKRSIPGNDNPAWNKTTDLIAKRYPGYFKSRGGKLYKIFDLPDHKFYLDKKLNLKER